MYIVRLITVLVALASLEAAGAQPEFVFKNFRDSRASVQLEENRAVFTITSSNGIGDVTVKLKSGQWPRDVTILLNTRNLEAFGMTTDRFWAHGSLGESGRFGFSLRNAKGEFEPDRIFVGSLNIQVKQHKGGMEIVLPANLLLDMKEVTFGWLDAYRR